MGTNISITDAWIPDSVNFRLSSEINSLHVSNVEELIDSNNKSWKVELINNTFTEEDAARILRIPLAQTPHEDFLFWGGEMSGEFTVRSAYKLLQRSIDNPRAYALQTIYRNFYKKLWSLSLPTKIKVTIWRLSWNYLPTKVNLQHRKLTVNQSCPRCGEGAETMNHLFRDYPATNERSLTFITVDSSVVHSGPYGETGTKEYMNERLVPERKPQGGFIKINFDGAFNKSQNRSAYRVVVRDSEGKILLSCTEIHENISSAFAAEAIAYWKAVQIGTGKGWQFLIFEGDSLAVIKKCNIKGQDRSMIGTYIYDIQQQIYRLDKIRFQHAPRSANSLAHILATETLKRGEEIYLDMGVPEYAEEQSRYEMRREPD
ncbi:hypothetical protein Goshw_004076 [Gossypium schwendimanii]|uniref:RNase H type-1 domain-containing protein n=1 Tax=Gossypium schwendimanii TaxID=34291 RepID=A0A7J9MXV1_GOSSC|nr:hypothetical protein [Gossypium schwendimanii]